MIKLSPPAVYAHESVLANPLFRRRLDRVGRDPAEPVAAAGGVAEFLTEVRQHRLEHARIDRRRGVVIEIYRGLDGHSPTNPGAIGTRKVLYIITTVKFFGVNDLGGERIILIFFSCLF